MSKPVVPWNIQPEIHTLKDIRRVNDFDDRRVTSVTVRGKQEGTSYDTSMRYFFPQGVHAGYIRIESPTFRQLHWQNISPAGVQRSLLRHTRTITELTDGEVKIHPGYGAVFGAKQDTIAGGIAKREGLREDTMFTNIVLPQTSEERLRINDRNYKDAIAVNNQVRWLEVFHDLHPEYVPEESALPMSLDTVRDVTMILHDLGLFSYSSLKVHLGPRID